MRFSILGALLGTVALAGAGGVAITQTSATDSLPITGSPLNARVALAADPSTSPPADPSGSPSPSATPTNGEYTAKTQVVKRRGASYLNVSVTYEGAALFNVTQKVCKRRTCKTASTDITVVNGQAKSTTRLGSGTYRKRGQAGVSMAPLPTVTVRETVTVTEPGPTVTVTEPGPTVTETFTCQPYVEPTDTIPPSEEPTGSVSPTDSVSPTVTDTAPPSETPTPTPSDTVTPTVTPTSTPTETPTVTPPTVTPTVTPTDTVSPTVSPTEIPTCPPPSSEPPPDTPTETPTETPTATPTDTTTATPSESISAPTQ
ncbi:hypothetical protein [Nonomuraea sp. NPDC050643]|uniref:hypothetical protein n=1 Tax=Nonomuraea sp. NPDC050643 TaxID=3155660 RepID=UPI0033FD6240